MAELEFKHTADLDFKDYEVSAGDTAFTAKIETIDSVSLVVLGDSSVDEKLPLLYIQDTTVKATFTGDYTTHPDYPFGIYGILEIDIRNVGGKSYIKQISTLFDNTNDFWKGAVATNRADITLNPSDIIVEADIDFTKLSDDISSYKISARIGRIAEEPFCLTTEDGIKIVTEDLLGCITIETP